MSVPLIDLTAARILIVDDSELNRDLLSALLKARGFANVIFANDGHEGLRQVREAHPDLVLLDVMMPGLDGYDMCRELRADPATADLPVIFQTALSGPEQRKLAFSVGASDIVSKSADLLEIVDRVAVHLRAALLARDLKRFHDRLTEELETARVVLVSLLPSATRLAQIEERTGLGIDAVWMPSSELGGDYWTLLDLENGRIGLLLADIVGHGVAAALRISSLHSALSPTPPSAIAPSLLLDHLSRRLSTTATTDGAFVCALYLLIDPAMRSIRCVGAGFRDALLVSPDGQIRRIEGRGLPLGIASQITRREQEIRYRSGDILICYSDALAETPDASGQLMEEAALREWLVATLRDIQAEGGERPQLAHRIADAFCAIHGDDLVDDLMIVVTRLP